MPLENTLLELQHPVYYLYLFCFTAISYGEIRGGRNTHSFSDSVGGVFNPASPSDVLDTYQLLHKDARSLTPAVEQLCAGQYVKCRQRSTFIRYLLSRNHEFAPPRRLLIDITPGSNKCQCALYPLQELQMGGTGGA